MTTTQRSNGQAGTGTPRDVAMAVADLGRFAASASWDDLSATDQDRLKLSLLDNIGLTIAGHQAEDVRALVAAWNPPDGPAQLFGTGRRAGVDDAAWLNGVAACVHDLDEGNKFSCGHPITHVISAAVAVATERGATGRQLLEAVMVGSEIAARFGRAMRPTAGLHTHGHWGNAGAAAAVGRLMGLGPSNLAGAIDMAGGLVLATSFESALLGSFVRNMWLGASNALGVVAARLAAAGLATVDGTAALTLGQLLGELDASTLTEELGQRWDTGTGYFKRHASCSYTHPPADAALELRTQMGAVDLQAIDTIEVATHRLAAPLNRTHLPTRLAAMFSIPYVVAVALLHGDCGPRRFDEAHRADLDALRLVERTHVVALDSFDARLPGERAARVSVRLVDGRVLTAEAPNPIGDADHHPFGRDEILAKLDDLFLDGPEIRAADVAAAIEGLPQAADVAAVLARLG